MYLSHWQACEAWLLLGDPMPASDFTGNKSVRCDNPMRFVRAKRLKIESQPIFSQINAASAEVWKECCNLMDWYQYQRGYGHAHWNFYIGEDCEGWMDKNLTKSQPLHSQSIQAVRASYFKSWISYSVLKKTGGVRNLKPPNKRKKYRTTQWKRSAITFVESSFFGKRVRLSMGAGRPKLDIKLPKNFDMSTNHLIATIELVYDYGQWELHFTYYETIELPESGKGVMGVDIGEIHPMVCFDGQDTLIFNGRYIRSLYRLRNKVLAGFNSAISQCQRHSKRWWRLTRRKWKKIRRIDNQIKDCLHKHTRKLLDQCELRGIGTIVVGDLTGIRDNIDYGKKSNQKLHQWPFAKLVNMITYKAKALGIKVKHINEAYTSQTCPKCGNRKKPTNREYSCKCGFTYHRDGVGAINIRQKYLGCLSVPVVADMAPPLGFRLEVPVALA
ncbi:transposase [Candidatus Poribacteria bacterium]|nr:MAG: transposase [Candidatus Poribacteria bacterium]